MQCKGCKGLNKGKHLHSRSSESLRSSRCNGTGRPSPAETCRRSPELASRQCALCATAQITYPASLAMLDLLRDPAAFRSACRTTKPSVIPFAPGSRTAPANFLSSNLLHAWGKVKEASAVRAETSSFLIDTSMDQVRLGPEADLAGPSLVLQAVSFGTAGTRPQAPRLSRIPSSMSRRRRASC